jgi:hypothetical protein
MLSSIADNAILTESSHSPLQDYDNPFTIDMEYEIADYSFGEEKVYFSLPIASKFKAYSRLYDYAQLVTKDKRTYPIYLRNTVQILVNSEIELPEDLTIEDLPDPVEIDTPIASYSFNLEVEDNTIIAKSDFKLKKIIVQTEQYANFKKVIDSFENIRNTKIQLIPVWDSEKKCD